MTAARCDWHRCTAPAVASVGYTTSPGVEPPSWRPLCQPHLETCAVDPNHRAGMVGNAAEHGEEPVFVVIDQRIPQAAEVAE